MVYRIDFLNHTGKPMVKVFRVQHQAEDYVAYLAKHGYDSITTSWSRTQVPNKAHKRTELQECLNEVKHD